MKFRIQDLQNYLKRKIDKAKIAEILTMKAFETSIEKDVLDIDILPNRFADSGSLIGMAKEIALLTKNEIISPQIRIKETKKNISQLVKVINLSSQTPFYFGRVILNIKNKPSPSWLKEFVEFYGLNSINLVVDLANFVMIEYNAPLHIFDLDKIYSAKNSLPKEIIIRESKKGEKFFSLDNKEYELPQNAILITDKKNILALAGIKGSKFAEVDLNTKNIFIEAAIFNPETIYQISRNLNLITEASYRFERKVIPQRTLGALERISSLIQTLANGDICKGKIMIKKSNLFPKNTTKINYERLKKYLGVDLSKKEIDSYVKKINNERLDINSEEDIYEEIGRLYGFDNIPKKFNYSPHPSYLDNKIEFNYLLKDYLVKLNFSEVYFYSFIGEKDAKIFAELAKEKIFLSNPISENYKYYQFSLLPNLVKAVAFNQKRYREIKIFNISKTAERVNEEKYKLAIVCALKNREETLKEIKSVFNYLMKKLNIKINQVFKKEKFDFSNIACSISLKNEKIGIMGLFSQKTETIYDLDLNVAFLEIDLEKLINFYQPYSEFVYWGDYPEITRDISFLVDKNLDTKSIIENIKKVKLLNFKNIELLDIYFPKEDNHKKSITLRLVFQNPKKTLKDEEVEKEINKITKTLKESFKAEIR